MKPNDSCGKQKKKKKELKNREKLQTAYKSSSYLKHLVYRIFYFVHSLLPSFGGSDFVFHSTSCSGFVCGAATGNLFLET